MNNLDLLSIASWLAISVVALQYYVNNFLKPKRWVQFTKKTNSSELKNKFLKKWDLIILLLFIIAVGLGLLGIIEMLVN
jgi:hypothetical protein